MNKIVIFILLALTLVGILGGIGYTAYYKAWIVTVGLVAAGYVIYPRVVELIKNLVE